MDHLLFNETQSRVIISVRRGNAEAAEQLCAAAEIPLNRLGEVGGPDFIVTNGQETLTWEIAELYETWYCSIERAMSSH
jgi:phosphoribosylformylglycinamidine (FGAM) synthase-like enzyme